MKRIMIAIPCSDTMPVETVGSLWALKIPQGYECILEFIRGYGAAQARNIAATKCLEGGYDYILYIDSDQTIPPDTLEKLLACNADLAFGWSMMNYGDNRTNISFYKEEERWYDFFTLETIPEGIVTIDACGFAVCLIKSYIFRALEYPYFRYIEYENKTALSEDLFFCEVARKNNMRLVCDTSIRCGHVKKVIV